MSAQATVAAAEVDSGIRATSRLELSPALAADVDTLLRQVAGASPAEPIDRLRAAGSDLVYLRGFAALLEHQSVDAEMEEGRALFLCAVTGGVVRSLDRLVRRLDQEVGLERGRAWRVAGIRETYMVRVGSPEVRRALHRVMELAHAESLAESAPPPQPLMLSMEGLAAELAYVADYLSAEGTAIARDVGEICRRLAGAVRCSLETSVPSPLLRVGCTSRPDEDGR